MNFFHGLDKQKVWNSWKNTGLFFNGGRSGTLAFSASSSSDFSRSAFRTGIRQEYCSVISPEKNKNSH